MSRANKALTCDMDRMHNITTFVFITLATIAAACGPCNDTIVAAPGANFDHVCIPDDDGGAEVGESGVGGEGEESSGDPTGGACGVTYAAGEDFGPCISGACNIDASTCATTKLGTVCMPACESCSADAYGQCISDIVCGLAGPECAINCANGQGCSVEGMACDVPSGLCVWPNG